MLSIMMFPAENYIKEELDFIRSYTKLDFTNTNLIQYLIYQRSL